MAYDHDSDDAIKYLIKLLQLFLCSSTPTEKIEEWNISSYFHAIETNFG